MSGVCGCHVVHTLLTFSALEALRNALYKFKTYLLTYYEQLCWCVCAVVGQAARTRSWPYHSRRNSQVPWRRI